MDRESTVKLMSVERQFLVYKIRTENPLFKSYYDREKYKAYNVAIKSIEDWDNVLSELINEVLSHDGEDFMDYRMGLYKAINIIETHLRKINEGEN